MSDTPLSKAWRRAKESAPRQKAIAAAVRTVRKDRPRAGKVRDALVVEAARRGVTDLSDKELATMTDAVTMSAKEAASEAVNKGTAGVKSLWSSLQTTKPAWIELPDNVAALIRRGDQHPVDVSVVIEVPETVQRLVDDLPADAEGERSFNVWIALEESTRCAAVCVGTQRLGRVPDDHVAAIGEELQRRRFWVPATLHDGTVTISLPDRA